MREERPFQRLVTWDEIAVHVSGARLAQIAGDVVRAQRLPVRKLELTFAADDLQVDLTVEKMVPVPVRFHVREILVDGGEVRVPLHNVAAFGFFPVPEALLEMVARHAKSEVGRYDRARNEIVIGLDRFLPSFVDAVIEEIRIVPDGVAVRLGPGGADPPIPGGVI